MKNNKALVLASFDKSYKPVVDAIERTLESRAIELVILDDRLNPSAVWSNVITDAIKEADLIIVDVSKTNPNIFSELGFARALRKPTLLILAKNEIDNIPSDLTSYQMVFYDPENLSTLQKQLLPFLDYQKSKWEAV